MPVCVDLQTGFFVFRTMKIMKASEDKVSAHKNIGISDCCS